MCSWTCHAVLGELTVLFTTAESSLLTSLSFFTAAGSSCGWLWLFSVSEEEALDISASFHSFNCNVKQDHC